LSGVLAFCHHVKISQLFWHFVLMIFASNMHARRPQYVTRPLLPTANGFAVGFAVDYIFWPSICLVNAAARESAGRHFEK